MTQNTKAKPMTEAEAASLVGESALGWSELTGDRKPRAKKASDQEWMTTAQAADYLGCSVRTLEGTRSTSGKKRHRPGPPWHSQIGGIRYKRSELDEYITAQRRTGPPPRPVPPRPKPE